MNTNFTLIIDIFNADYEIVFTAYCFPMAVRMAEVWAKSNDMVLVRSAKKQAEYPMTCRSIPANKFQKVYLAHSK